MMKAALFKGKGTIEPGERPDPAIIEPTDAVVRVVLACVCGSDLWYYRGDSPFEPGPIGHEFIGVVEDIGAEVTTLAKSDLVISPFAFSDGTCPNCQNGITTACMNGGFFPMNGDGGQGEAVRVPLADTTLVTVPGQAMQTAIDIARAGSMVGFVGVPHGVELPIGQMFSRTVGVRGGGAPVRVYLPNLLDDVLAERINPGRVLDYETDLDGIADA